MKLIQKIFTKPKPKVSMRSIRRTQHLIGSDPKKYADHMNWRTEEEKTHFWGDETWRKYEAQHKAKIP